MAYTHFHADAFTNIHWCDLFYWEHRLTKWGGRFLQEVDLTGFAISPYNSRRIIETMLSVPYAARAAKTVQLQLTVILGGSRRNAARHLLKPGLAAIAAPSIATVTFMVSEIEVISIGLEDVVTAVTLIVVPADEVDGVAKIVANGTAAAGCLGVVLPSGVGSLRVAEGARAGPGNETE